MKFADFLKDRSLNERFLNQLKNDVEMREKYAEQVWDVLQFSYRDIGGIKGSGFSSIQDMIDNIPFWKMVTKNGEVHAVVMYKDQGGRKSVQMGVKKNSEYGKQKVQEILQQDIKRAYTERSKGALGLTMKLVPWVVLEGLLIDYNEVKKRYPDAVRIVDTPKKDWPEDALETLRRFPQLVEYGYLRDIGGTPTFKVMLGTPDIGIK